LWLRGVEPVLHRYQPAAGAFELVEDLADLTDAAPGQPVQFPDDKRVNLPCRDGSERGVEPVTVRGLGYKFET